MRKVLKGRDLKAPVKKTVSWKREVLAYTAKFRVV